MTKTTVNRVQTFINSCLRRILKIHWPEKISNIRLWERTQQIPAKNEIGQRRWGWIGHSLRKPVSSNTRRVLSWNPQGKRKRGRPRNTWLRDLQADIKRLGTTWSKIEGEAQDRSHWRSLVDGLYPGRGDWRKLARDLVNVLNHTLNQSHAVCISYFTGSNAIHSVRNSHFKSINALKMSHKMTVKHNLVMVAKNEFKALIMG